MQIEPYPRGNEWKFFGLVPALLSFSRFLPLSLLIPPLSLSLLCWYPRSGCGVEEFGIFGLGLEVIMLH